MVQTSTVHRLIALAALALLIGVVSNATNAADDPASPKSKNNDVDANSPVGKKVANFVLPDQDGREVALTDFSDSRALVLFFTGTNCPISNLYLTELSELAQRHEKVGVRVVGVNSNNGVTQDDLRKHAEEFKFAFPVLLDGEQRVADLLGATRTAEVFLLDREQVVRYHGRIDDRFGYTYKNAKPTRRDLEEAVNELLADKPVSVPETKPLGCLITRAKRTSQEAPVTYAKDVSRILARRCSECHRPGQIGPLTLLTYDDAVKSADMLKEVVLEGRMPPWHADSRYGEWSNTRKMSQNEVDTLVSWIDSGTPLGDEKDLPPAKEYAEGWTIDKPDVVFELPEEVTVQADGVVPYVYFRVPTNFKEDVLIQAAEARPGNRAVVHHIIVFYRVPDGTGWRKHGQVCGTAPGDPPLVLPPGVALRIPAGAELLFQMHYTPTGKEEKDRSRVGFVLYKQEHPPVGYFRTKGIMNRRFEIPAGEANHLVESSYTFKDDVKLLSLMPHMHVRGKDFLYRAVYPDGRTEVLLSVPRYDFNWQNSYRFVTPRKLPKGTRLECVAHYDNSTGNPANPDPTTAVRWGDQTWEEMMIGWIGYLPDGEAATGPSADDGSEHVDGD